MRLYIGNLPFSATEADVRDFFWPLVLDRVTLCTDRETGRFRGFAFVEVGDSRAAEVAIRDLHGTDFGGRRAVVSEAIRKSHSERRSDHREVGLRRDAQIPNKERT